ncbi:MAG: alpha/beta hydrolase [Deltaproteobacteria bacterium]|nr:MAG: alpha/beta hydrolase [Deltaproteobacteria bacterium]
MSFFAGWLTGELALHHIAFQVLLASVFLHFGVVETLPGRIGLGIMLLAWLGLALAHMQSRRAGKVVEAALAGGLGSDYEAEIAPDLRPRLSWEIPVRHVIQPFPLGHPEVERIRDVVYHRVRGLNLRLDLYRHRDHPENCPILVEIHGGGWVIGSKNQQGLPLMYRMAAQGWLCVNVNYRLSPHATFPEHLIDLKEAVRWIREHAAAYGGDPGFLATTGESAGGHLSSLMALTGNDPEYQPGFESADTSIQAALSFYGVYDFLDVQRYWRHDRMARLLEHHVMKASMAEATEAYRKASPLWRVHSDAPPFFVIHGDHDTMVPVAQARDFVRVLREVSRNPVVYAEIPGAQHAFEIFYSLRTLYVLAGVERFLFWVWSRHRARRSGEEVGQAGVVHPPLEEEG